MCKRTEFLYFKQKQDEQEFIKHHKNLPYTLIMPNIHPVHKHRCINAEPMLCHRTVQPAFKAATLDPPVAEATFSRFPCQVPGACGIMIHNQHATTIKIDTKRAPPSKRCATGCWCHISLSAAAVADVHVSLFHFAIVQLQDENPLHLESKISPSIIVFCTVRSIIVCANLQFTMVCEDNICANLPTKAARYSVLLPKEALPVLPLLWNH